MSEYRFPQGFVWGSATASYQIEGAAQVDGRGESVWDRFSHTPGKTFEGHTGDVADDHYHRWADDIKLMQEIGLQGYRFSIAWPRILPDGTGAINKPGLDFYDRLVDGLLAAGITPFATLYHWDLPQSLQDRQGGWTARAIVDQFVHYADVVTRALGDRVTYWATFNEPRIFVTHGYELGWHAPGVIDPPQAIQAAHHVMLAHGAAVPVIRRNSPQAQVGIVYALNPIETADTSPEGQARQHLVDARTNRWFVEPVLAGTYPDVLIESAEFAGLDIQPGDMATINAPVDWVGVNYYSRIVVGGPEGDVMAATVDSTADAAALGGLPRTEMGWEIYPHGLTKVLTELHARYHPPAIYITENGAACDDVLTEGRVHDAVRVAYLRDHFRAALVALEAGVPLRGYMVWSLLDNFEWAFGFSKRFGLIHVNYDTLNRTLKDSAHYFKRVIAANAAVDEA